MKQPSLRNLSNKLTSLVANIPRNLLVISGRLLGTIAYVLDHRHRQIVVRNLQFTHPNWPRDRIRKLSIHVFQNFGIAILEILQLACMSGEDILRRVRIRGKQNLIHALEGPNGIIAISAHIGNWEMAPPFVSNYFGKRSVSVARQVSPEWLDRWIYWLRTRFGNTIVDKKGALPTMARTLKKGNILGILIDQGTKRSQGVEVKFFGRTTTATPVAAMLARRFDSTVLLSYCIREPGKYLTLVVEPPLHLQKTDDVRADLQNNTQIMTDAIERAVKKYPEQWFWFHKRWKRHHPEIYEK
jgi:KDO2-lipid IV(A) lauroyltransferase